MRRKKKSKNLVNQGKKIQKYEGPFQANPNLISEQVRKSMQPISEGPTVDTFSKIDSTDAVNDSNVSNYNHTKRPTKEKSKNWFRENSFEIVLTLIISTIFTGGGIIVYNHSNNFVSIEKDIEYIKTDIDDQDIILDAIDNKIEKIDRNLDLVNYKLDDQKNANQKKP